ncbi:MAG: DUF2029 domain-containing protein, partial [Planctomycetota bacterium]
MRPMTHRRDQTSAATAPPQRLIGALAVLYTVVICFIVTQRAESSSDFRDFWENAVALRETGVIRSDLGVHNYLPAFTLLMFPWSFLPLRLAIVLFTLLSLGAYAHAVLLCRSIIRRQYPDAPEAAVAVAVGLQLAYVTSCAVVGAWGLILTWLVVLAFAQHLAGRDVRAGALLGTAAVIKLLPALLLGYFLIVRRWRLAAGAGATILVLGGLLPWLVLGTQEFAAQHRAFAQRALRDHSAWQTIHADKPIKANFSNNALPMVLRRLLSPVDAAKGERADPLFVNVADLSRKAAWAIYVTIVTGLLLVTMLATLLSPDRQLAFAAWCCLMLLLSPLVWTHYLPLTLWPLVALAARGAVHHARTGRPHRRIATILFCWLIAVVALASPAARAAGAQMFSVLLLW